MSAGAASPVAVEDDGLLPFLDCSHDEDYADDIGTQIDMTDLEEPDKDGLILDSQEDVDRNPSTDRRLDLPIDTLKPSKIAFRLPDDEDIIDVEDFSSSIGESAAQVKTEHDNVLLSTSDVNDHRESEHPKSDVEIIWPDLESHGVGLSNSDDENDVLEVDQDQEAHVKAETEEIPFHWVDMEKGIIDLSDTDVGGSQTAKVKAESSEPGFLWTSMGEHPIEISDTEEGVTNISSPLQVPEDVPMSNFGTSLFANASSRANHKHMDISKIAEAQRRYRENFRGKPTPTGAGGIFRGLGRAEKQPGLLASGYDFEMDGAEKFRDMKQKYEAQKKAGKISEQDEIMFMAAEKKEKARHNRFIAEYKRDNGLLDSEDDEDEAAAEDDERLFGPRFLKRSLEHGIDSDDAASEDEGEPSAGKRPKTNLFDKKAYMKELRMEEYHNMMAGCEKMIHDEKKKGEKEKKKTEKELTKGQKKDKSHKVKKSTHVAANAASKVKKSAAPKKKSRPKVRKPNPNRMGYLNDLSTLMSSNVCKDANANLDKKKLATTSATRKKEALADLLAGIDDDNLPSARREKNHLDRSMKILGNYKVKSDGKGRWKLKGNGIGMASSLHHYQIQGSAFMKERETGEVQPRGGLLADEMGLGKTVMAIGTIESTIVVQYFTYGSAAAMVANRPASGSEARCTLIVATPALVNQWNSELRKHLEPGVLSYVVKHCGSSKISGGGESFIMHEANVVLTTYQELVKSYPRCEPPPELTTLEEKKDWWINFWDQTRGPLHRAFFHRVILDEAQAIKNHMSLTSIACRAVMARHRWAISGTPIQNRVSELYPYFRYLRVKNTGSFEVFKQNFCIENDEDCTERLHSYLRQFMMRRTHKTELMGAPLLTLPRTDQQTITIEFSELERTLYKVVRNKFVREINYYSKEGKLESKSRFILTLCLRLRQLTAHPFLIQDVIQDFFTLEDIERLWSLSGPEVSDSAKRGKEMYSAMKNMLEDLEQISGEGQAVAEEPLPNQNDGMETSETPGLVFRFRKYLRNFRKNGQWTELKERSLCHKCNCPPDEPWVTNCFHLYCKECLSNMAYEASKNGKTQSLCIPCDEPFEESRPCSGIEELEMEDSSTIGYSIAKDRPRRKQHQKEAARWLDLEGEVLLSSKTRAAKIQIGEWLKAEPEKKIIVFSQFKLLMKILAKVCDQSRWGYCNYNGDMSHEARDESLTTFGNDPEKQILIASLKCGGVGLNLTMASKVICIDLWWNSCVEQQAFCRVFRIGQESETHITRFVVKDTIDEYLIKMQKEKEEAIGQAIDDNKMLKQLPLPDLMRLFGPVTKDSDGRHFILVEDEELGFNIPSKEKSQRPKKQPKSKKKPAKGGKGAKASNRSVAEVNPEDDDSDGLFIA